MKKRIIVSVFLIVSIMAILSFVSAIGPDVYFTDHDKIPNFGLNPTVTSKKSGNWEDPQTWGGKIPLSTDVVLINENHIVTITTTTSTAHVVSIQGKLQFITNQNTKLTVTTLLVTPDGFLEIGNAQNPIASTATAEIIFRDYPLAAFSSNQIDPLTNVKDPEQYGNGLLVLGNIATYGVIQKPFVRVAVEPKAGDKLIKLAEPVSWRTGDTIVISDTRHLPLDVEQRYNSFIKKFPIQTEVKKIQSMSLDKKEMTLATPLKYDHKGAYYPDGSPARFKGEPLLPHVGQVTRNIIMRSENPQGTRAHAAFFHHASVKIYNTGFYDMGRTRVNDSIDSTTFNTGGIVNHIGANQIGRYPFHLHHEYGPYNNNPAPTIFKINLAANEYINPSEVRNWLASNYYQFEVVGNVVASGVETGYQHPFKWGIAIHDAHFGLVKDNLVYNVAGSGMVTEDGSESFNLITDNMVVHTIGNPGRVSIANTKDTNLLATSIGADATGFWFRGSYNWVEKNVATDTPYSGLYYSGYYQKSVNVPLYPGASTMKKGEYRTINIKPLLSFKDNEAYGAMNTGLYGSWIAGCCSAKNWPELLIEDNVFWHVYKFNIQWYHTGKTTFRNIHIVGDPLITTLPTTQTFSKKAMETTGFQLSEYENIDLTLENLDIRGQVNGMVMPTWNFDGEGKNPTVVKNSYLENYVNIQFPEQGNQQRKYLIDNVKFKKFNNPPNGSNIVSRFAINDQQNQLMNDEIIVKNYNGIMGNNFIIFKVEQHPLFIVPYEGWFRETILAPQSGKSNYYWEQEKLAGRGGAPIGGMIARYKNGSSCTTASPTEFQNEKNTFFYSKNSLIGDIKNMNAKGQLDAIYNNSGSICKMNEPDIHGYIISLSELQEDKFPIVTILSPTQNSLLKGDKTLFIQYIVSGNLSEVNHVHLQLDNQVEVRDFDFDGKYSFPNLKDRMHTIRVYAARADHSFFSNQEAMAISSFTFDGDCIDEDDDGYGEGCNFTFGSSDCNDDEFDIHPNATELCDQQDNDCDNIIDEGCRNINSQNNTDQTNQTQSDQTNEEDSTSSSSTSDSDGKNEPQTENEYEPVQNQGSHNENQDQGIAENDTIILGEKNEKNLLQSVNAKNILYGIISVLVTLIVIILLTIIIILRKRHLVELKNHKSPENCSP